MNYRTQSTDWSSRYYRRPTFRPPHGIQRKPVKGGRWEVRRHPYPLLNEDRRWRAVSHGASQHLSRSFPTQVEAIAWAQRVAAVYAMPKGEEKDEAYFQLRVEKYGDRNIIKGVFPDRPRKEREGWRFK